MRRLTPRQIERLRIVAAASLGVPESDWPDLGIAPEDLLVACDAALGFDTREENEEKRRALVETYQQRCAEAWRRGREAQVGPTHAEWLRERRCVRFSAVFFNRGGDRHEVQLDFVAIHAEARRLRESPAVPWVSFPKIIERRRSQ